ncbi:unnamed protein product [Diabrotica balteata]|uniref:Uncharacterized protein n=1 Tax=Diabrotica balteata TaxID=107213 RepID=A0A9N9XGJ7_DIABA|nr:unnamed protein product [Diabrotica balteata]
MESSKPGSSMDTETVIRVEKRAKDIIDTLEPIVSAKKVRVDPNVELKVKCLRFMECYEKMVGNTLRKDEQHMNKYLNINFSQQITSIIFSAFTILRQEANGIVGVIGSQAKIGKFYSITSMAQQMKIIYEGAQKIVKKAATKEGLEFKKFNRAEENWINELRLGRNDFPIGKNPDGSTRAFQVPKYGFNGMHDVLLKGLTYPPEKRSLIAQSLGAMTVLLLHVKTPQRYRQKWTAAAKNTKSHTSY